MLAHRQLGDQRHRDQPRRLRQGRHRGGKGTAGDEPVIDAAVNAEIERSGPIHPPNAKQQIKDEQRLGQRQQHHRDPGHQHRDAEGDARAVAVEQRADQRRRQCRQYAAERHCPRQCSARPAEFAGQRLDKDRQGGDRRALPGKAGAAQASEDDPAVKERQAPAQQIRQRRAAASHSRRAGSRAASSERAALDPASAGVTIIYRHCLSGRLSSAPIRRRRCRPAR